MRFLLFLCMLVPLSVLSVLVLPRGLPLGVHFAVGLCLGAAVTAALHRVEGLR